MLSKNPIDIVRDKSFTREEVEQALRLAIIAELDAINLYQQLAGLINDEDIRKVFLDIAREEKTHVGEFLTLLKSLDREQVEELKRGMEEVRELTGLEISDPPSDIDFVVKLFLDALDKYRVLRKHLPVKNIGGGFEYVTVYRGGVFKPVGFAEISVGFTVDQRLLDYSLREQDYSALSHVVEKARELAYMEEECIIKGCNGLEGLTTAEGVIVRDMSDWSTPKKASTEISQAYLEMLKHGITPPFLLIVSPKRYLDLLIAGSDGILEIQRLKSYINEIVYTAVLTDDTAILVAANNTYIDVVVSTDTRVDYIGLEDGKHRFRAWETITIRLKNPKAITVFKQK